MKGEKPRRAANRNDMNTKHMRGTGHHLERAYEDYQKKRANESSEKPSLKNKTQDLDIIAADAH